MEALLNQILAWVTAHPLWAGVAVFLVSLAESLAVVGVLVPGVAMMFGVGALIGLGHLAFGPMMAWAVAGAVVGDGLSFWLGRRYRDHLRQIWPFKQHPEALTRGEAFFHRHGAKSVLLGRFVGPVRAIIPLVAGMVEMPPRRFLAANVASALAWAPMYLLPGMLFGASLEVASEVAGRLAVLLVLVLVFLWLLLWLGRRLFNGIAPHALALVRWLAQQASRHPYLGQLPAALVDPEHPEAPGLALLAALLLLTTILFGLSLYSTDGGVPAWDYAVLHLFQSLRNPLADDLFVWITELGNHRVASLLAVGIGAWLLLKRRWSAAAHWAAAAAFALFAPQLIKAIVALPRPPGLENPLGGWGFPSGHTVKATVLFGFLAVLISRESPRQQRWLPYGVALSVIGAIALSRIYLGAHWVTDVLGGLGLGGAWVALLGLAYGSRFQQPVGRTGLILTTGLCLGLGGVYGWIKHDEIRQHYRPLVIHRAMSRDIWLSQGWQQLPSWREDLLSSHRYPMNVQAAGPLESLKRDLEAQGWRAAPRADALALLRLLNPNLKIVDMPLLPHVHAGAHETLALTLWDPKHPGQRLVLRLWPSGWTLKPGATPLWLGEVSEQKVARLSLLAVYPRTQLDRARPLDQLERDLKGHAVREIRVGVGPVLLLPRYSTQGPGAAPETAQPPGA